ncbi:MAG: hypothetical protein P8J87_05240, partial [Verrucomicrobiales bacterium]|nr:hypothetical protein [Verrucomicrobiales bacterium]
MPRTPTTAVLTLAAFATGVAADRFLFHSPATGQSSLNPSANAPVITNNTPLSEEQSPPGAPFSSSLDDLRTLVDPSSSHHAGNRVHRALDNASASDLQNLISKLASSGSPADRTLRTTLYHRLAGLDPTAALGSLLAEDDHLLKTSAIHGIFNSLARTDLNAAKAALASIENPELRRRALHGMAEAVGHASPHSFANYLTTVPDGHHLSDFFHMWSLRDPDAAIAFVANTADPTQRDHWSHGIGRGLALQDPALAIDWLSTLDPGQSSFRSSAEPAIEILAQTDPALAAEFLGTLPASHQRRDLVEHLARNWSLQDLPAALRWSDTLDPRERSSATGVILDGWVRTDPAAAAAHLDTLTPSESTLDLTRHLAHRWAQSDPQAALGWALSRDGTSRTRALEGATGTWASTDPENAAAFALALDNPADQRHAVNAVARRWSGQDLVGAVGWIQDLPTPLQREASAGLIDQLAEHDPRQAASVFEAVSSLNGSTPAHLAAEIAGRWGELAPAESAAWATSLKQGTPRREA